MFTRCNHVSTLVDYVFLIFYRRLELTEKRVHPRRRRRRGSGVILEERRRPHAFPPLNRCPRASRVPLRRRRGRAARGPLSRISRVLRCYHVLSKEEAATSRTIRYTRNATTVGNLRDRLPCHYCSIREVVVVVVVANDFTNSRALFTRGGKRILSAGGGSDGGGGLAGGGSGTTPMIDPDAIRITAVLDHVLFWPTAAGGSD